MALAGSRWLVMKNSARSPTGEDEEEAVVAGGGEKRGKKERGRGRVERKVGVEVGEAKVMSRQVTRTTGLRGVRGWKIQSSRETDRQTGRRAGGQEGRQARESSPEWSRHWIRAASPPCLGLLHGDNTQHESFMRRRGGGWGVGVGGFY